MFVILPGFVDKAPGISNSFPGDFDSPPQLVKADLEITATRHDWFATGYYLPAGQEATIKVTNRYMSHLKI